MKKLMLGNEAIARGAYEAGVRVVTAYPGTPSTEISEAIAQYSEVSAQWSPNEKVALEVAIGASVAGARAMAVMKHVGLNVAADPLLTLSYTGVNGGLVIVVADDPDMHSSQNEQDTRMYGKFAKIPVIEASDAAESKEFIKAAFDLSEEFDTPVIFRSTTRLSHSSGVVELGERKEVALKEYRKDIGKYVMMPAMARKRHRVVEDRLLGLQGYGEKAPLNRIEWGEGKIGVITSGIPYQYVKEALPDAAILKLGLVYPLPKELILEFAKKFAQVYIVEELEPFFEEQIKSWGVRAIGKELFPVVGEFNSKMVAEKIAGQRIEDKQPSFAEGELLPRPPVLCPGCPHRGVFLVLRKLKAVVTGDIGCYTLGALAPLSAMDTTVCMGASIGMGLGMEKARGKEFGKKVVAVIGDSTFYHSGITGLVDVVYNGGNTTVVILDNSTTGMTGHQEHPGTGKNLRGEVAARIDLEKLVAALGVRRIRVVDPLQIKELEGILKEEMDAEEPSVVITKRSCALIAKKAHSPSITVIPELCRQCGLCLQSGCPGLVKGEEATRIDQGQCDSCGLCVAICPFNAIIKEGEANE